MKLWKRLVANINRRKKGTTFKKSKLFNQLKGNKMTAAVYISFLTKYGYLDNVDYGIYVVKRRIPSTVSIYSLKWGNK